MEKELKDFITENPNDFLSVIASNVLDLSKYGYLLNSKNRMSYLKDVRELCGLILKGSKHEKEVKRNWKGEYGVKVLPTGLTDTIFKNKNPNALRWDGTTEEKSKDLTLGGVFTDQKAHEVWCKNLQTDGPYD